MFSSKVLFALLLLPAFAMLGCPAAVAPQAAAPAVAPAIAGPMEIRVDRDCGFRQAGEPLVKRDPAVCHLESVLDSKHVEGADGGAGRSWVEIAEQEYLLQDVTPGPVTFVVEHRLLPGFSVDSDPQPTEMVGQMAVFRVEAQPGQIVRLHVGERRALPLPSAGN